MLGNIASYFVRGRDDGYLGGNAKNFSVGSLERAECEVPFTARFGLRDVLAAYNALPGIEAIGTDELMAMMGELVGGWPEGMREDLTIRLAGPYRPPRAPASRGRHVDDQAGGLQDGSVDAARQMANDLQLVCYQLGLAFPEHGSGGLRRWTTSRRAACSSWRPRTVRPTATRRKARSNRRCSRAGR